jgi:hypothetical protein
MNSHADIAVRYATAADGPALERLAALDSAPVPTGDVLIAKVGDEVQSALEIATGTAIADPFRRTAHLVELLGVRAASLRDGASSRRPLRSRLSAAYRAA